MLLCYGYIMAIECTLLRVIGPTVKKFVRMLYCFDFNTAPNMTSLLIFKMSQEDRNSPNFKGNIIIKSKLYHFFCKDLESKL